MKYNNKSAQLSMAWQLSSLVIQEIPIMGIQNHRKRGFQHCQHLFQHQSILVLQNLTNLSLCKTIICIARRHRRFTHSICDSTCAIYQSSTVKLSSSLLLAPHITQGFCSPTKHPENRDCADSSFLSLLRRALSVVVRPLLNLLYSSTFCNSRSLLVLTTQTTNFI